MVGGRLRRDMRQICELTSLRRSVDAVGHNFLADEAPCVDHVTNNRGGIDAQ